MKLNWENSKKKELDAIVNKINIKINSKDLVPGVKAQLLSGVYNPKIFDFDNHLKQLIVNFNELATSNSQPTYTVTDDLLNAYLNIINSDGYFISTEDLPLFASFLKTNLIVFTPVYTLDYTVADATTIYLLLEESHYSRCLTIPVTE